MGEAAGDSDELPTPRAATAKVDELTAEAEEAELEAASAVEELELAMREFRAICRDAISALFEDTEDGSIKKVSRTPSKDEVAMKRLMAGQMFSKVDADSSGLIDAGELQLMMVYLDLDLSESQCEMVMAEIDEDGSGEIDLEEFIIWFQRI